jgi:hypothetical protein
VEGLELQEAYFRGRKLQGTAIPIPQGILVCDSFFLSFYVCVLLFSRVYCFISCWGLCTNGGRKLWSLGFFFFFLY